MKLVVVESPTKARTISKFLGGKYTIKASMGHIMDLPKSKLGVDVEHDFAPQYENVEAKKEVISDLKQAAKSANQIILATDPDREGEAIASHVKDVLGENSEFKIQNSKFSRIIFHEITKEAIEEALKNPHDVDQNLVDAQTARRVLDRLVGYKLSPLLWKKVRRGLSAGRVQSIALRLIVEREREIEKFKKEKYWTITATLKSEKNEIADFELIEINNEKIEQKESFDLYDGKYQISKTSIKTGENAEEIIKDLNNSEFKVEDIQKKEIKRSPYAPFTTSTLQQEASRRFGFSGKKTMALAQKLYEEGFITYHRTDSVIVGSAAVFALRGYAEKEFGKNFVPEKPRFYKTKQKLAQEAHEAIRPTNVNLQISEVRALGRDHEKLYDLILRRAVASQMADAVTESTAVFTLGENSNAYLLKANGSLLKFPGFLKIYPQGLNDTLLGQFETGEVLNSEKIEKVEHETPHPPRYNDASLISTLEEKGIGRPSTYATIISTIEDRQYVEREEGRFNPTNVGIAVNDFLVENFSTIDDIPFTAEMEDELDRVANGEEKWVPIIKNFYGPFEKTLVEVENAKRVKIEVEKTNETCPQCSSPLVVRIGRFGKFLACSAFPTCRFTKPFVSETNYTCPKCGGKIILKKTKKGRKFYGCSNYPKCDFAAWKLADIQKTAADLTSS